MVSDPDEEIAFTRIIVEKPIGRDLDSARAVIASVDQAFAENQTYRIDHYLGKETVQNLLVLRFANSIFEPLWNGKYIDHVQITVAEEEGLAQFDPETGKITASRIGYYEGIGALRDMVQNHMLQVLCVVAMEPPHSLEPDVVRDAKVQRLALSAADDARRRQAQRRARPVHRGRRCTASACPAIATRSAAITRRSPRSRSRPKSVNSNTETFVAMRLFIDNWRWSGVPFYLRTGKRLPKRGSEVAIQFKDVPQVLFNDHPDVPLEPTVLTLKVQPEEGLSMRIASKLPGPKVRIYPVKMEFNYTSSFGATYAGSVRTAHPRRDGRRRHAVHAPRRGGDGVASG